ncbi:solute carrier family 52, riboflavin transporter, member 3-B-like [Actinia tenebrosa]|uniref:Riboflavin transporter n=1 Tax=Actinia tenebrosa TaxID=6105 RepID=A0A6P8IJW3_ACTTE|nr:solute carrier family 52, riboflavin transporter, member 3-B-like [Actinia tenebrosa]
MISKIKTTLSRSEVSWPTYLCVCVFGIGSWIAINGLWVELPLLVNRVPEKWNLPSYLTIIAQLANIGPLIFSIGNRLAPNQVTEKPVILLILSIGATSCVLLSIFWDRTSLLFGVEHSTALLLLSFSLAIVDCTSSVVFLTFMATFKTEYITALFVGETLSGMLPGFIGLAQGIGEQQKCFTNTTNNTHTVSQNAQENFGPSAFFLFLFGMMCLCAVAFLILNYMPFAKTQHVKVPLTRGLRQRAVSEDERQSLLGVDFLDRDDVSETCPGIFGRSCRRRTWQGFIYLLVIQAWINCLANGVLTSVQAYACKPYGNKAYHLVVTLTSIASAFTCFIALWLPSRSAVLVTVFSVLYTLLSAFVLVLASLSPTPPLHGTLLGSIIVVSVSVLSGGLVSYTKLTICSIMREIGQRALFWCGIAIQTGSFLGAIIMFPLVSVAKVFHQAKDSC